LLGRKEAADLAYHRAATYTYARTWDPNGGFFWSPAEAALQRLGSKSTADKAKNL